MKVEEFSLKVNVDNNASGLDLNSMLEYILEFNIKASGIRKGDFFSIKIPDEFQIVSVDNRGYTSQTNSVLNMVEYQWQRDREEVMDRFTLKLRLKNPIREPIQVETIIADSTFQTTLTAQGSGAVELLKVDENNIPLMGVEIYNLRLCPKSIGSFSNR